jgi:MFS family permease
LFGLRSDLKLNVGSRYTFAASIFYIGFVCGTYPAILLAQCFPLQRVVAIITLVWGACLLTTAACTTWQELWIQRFFLGFLEAGIPPIFMLVVGGWYTKHEQAMRMGIWYCSTGYTSAVSPLINYGLGHITGGSLSPWRYMCNCTLSLQ